MYPQISAKILSLDSVCKKNVTEIETIFNEINSKVNKQNENALVLCNFR